MALSPAHRLGQSIGEQLEAALHEPLQTIAQEFGLYLDYPHKRPARSNRKEVAWQDAHGNTHNLDYVLEEDGSENERGRPRAFIETAWRRYTKHSRNKVQEIQGAVGPLAETYQDCCPFLGAVLAGEFTEGALEQLQSHNFKIAYCPYAGIVQAFASEHVDISSTEGEPNSELQRKAEAVEHLTPMQKARIAKEILHRHDDQFTAFFRDLRASLERIIAQVFILPLSGPKRQFASLGKAIRFIAAHDQTEPVSDFVRYELIVRYSNGDEVQGKFQTKEKAVTFLRSFANVMHLK